MTEMETRIMDSQGGRCPGFLGSWNCTGRARVLVVARGYCRECEISMIRFIARTVQQEVRA